MFRSLNAPYYRSQCLEVVVELRSVRLYRHRDKSHPLETFVFLIYSLCSTEMHVQKLPTSDSIAHGSNPIGS